MRVHKPLFRIVKWPTPDWYYANGLYRFIKSTCEWWLKLVTRTRYKGKENFPMQGGVIVACNHFSWADPVLIQIPFPRPGFYLAKERLFKNPIMAWLFEGLGQIKVDRERGGNDAALRKAVEVLEAGGVVGVFPEGTRSRNGELKRGRTGVARIAALSGCPVLPVAITTAEFWPKHATFPRFGQRVYINIGKPMYFEKNPDLIHDRQRTREMTDEIMGEIKRLLDEAYDARARREGQPEWR